MSRIEVVELKRPDPRADLLSKRIEALVDQVRQRAYELSQLRLGEGFHELDDWLQAEHELLACQRCEVHELEGKLIAELDAADFEPTDLRVSVLGHDIVIEGTSRRLDASQMLVPEVGRSMFLRVFLSDEFDPGTLKAELHNGVLQLSAEKTKADHTTPPAGGNMPAEGIQLELRTRVSVATA